MSKHSDILLTRISDLNLDLARSPLHRRVIDLYRQLASRGLRFRPDCYFADEWFVPEGDPVIGVPFYLASQELRRIERRQPGEVEGGSKPYFMKLLRHEAGHAICYAFRLLRHPRYRPVFGPSNKRFSEKYRFNPKSRSFVINLKDHYAQSHPDEDFAETFAVWLQMKPAEWRKRYRGWPALEKLETVNRMMSEIRHKRPLVRSGEKMCHVDQLTYTLKTYYRRRRAALHRTGAHSV